MRKIGLIGGMSWESSIEYYRIINELIRERHGGCNLTSAECIMESLNFQEIADLQKAGAWDKLQKKLNQVALNLQAAGAQSILICTNTMHILAEKMQEVLDCELIHIADSTAREIKSKNISRVGLLGTAFTMEKTFYKDRLAQHQIETITPNQEDRQFVHHLIFNELCCGVQKPESIERFKNIITSLQEQGAKGAILGCTELPLIVKDGDLDIPLFDTTYLHARDAVEKSLSK